MSKKVNKQKKSPMVQANKRADGTTEYSISKAPQSTLAGKIIIIALALLLGGSAIASLILVLCQM